MQFSGSQRIAKLLYINKALKYVSKSTHMNVLPDSELKADI